MLEVDMLGLNKVLNIFDKNSEISELPKNKPVQHVSNFEFQTFEMTVRKSP